MKFEHFFSKQTINILRNLGVYFFDFFFTKICLLCRDRIILEVSFKENNFYDEKIKHKSTKYFCDSCKTKIEFAPHKDEITNNLVASLPENQPIISNAISLFSHSEEFPAFNLIYKLKYYGFTKIGIEYGIWLGKLLDNYGLKHYDFIVPVPIHKIKKRERGYNQSDLIAIGVHKILKIPIAKDLLKKIKHTKSQTQLSSTDRKTNLLDAFEVNNSDDLCGKKILLVDDVLTTGSTVNNCALCLLENSASSVDVATLLKA